MKNKNIENDCEHCAHGAKHYFNVNGTFQPTGCLHCICGELNSNQKRSRIGNSIKCEYRQPAQIQIDKRRQSIETALRDVAKKLNDIAEILREETESSH